MTTMVHQHLASLRKNLQAIQKHTSQSQTNDLASILLKLLPAQPGCMKVAVSPEDVRAIVAAMQGPHNIKLACASFGYLAACGHQNAAAIAGSGGIHAVVGAMQDNSDSVHVQRYGCRALMYLASANDHTKTAVGDAAAIPAIVCALKNHSDDARLKEYAGAALNALENCSNRSNTESRSNGITKSTGAEPTEVPSTSTRPTPTANATCAANSTKVAIVGGGPVGLVTALLLLDDGKQRSVSFDITVFEHRWVAKDGSKVTWCGKEENNNRRWQVVTIQSQVWSLLPKSVQESLFPTPNDGSFHEMWPYGPDSPKEVGAPRNVPVRTIEDKLLELVHSKPVTLVCKRATQQDLLEGYEFVIVANGGSGEPVLNFGERVPFPEDPQQRLRETVLGIFIQHPDTKSPAVGVTDAEGMALTVSNCRLLLNPLGRQMGFLCMWLTAGEAEGAIGVDRKKLTRCTQGKPCVMEKASDGTYRCKNPDHCGAMFLPAQNRENDSLWKSIKDGLQLYGIDEAHVKAFTTFQLGPFQKRATFAIELECRGCRNARRQPMAFLVGDAAMRVSFRAGRGLNTGLKGAVSLAYAVTRAAAKGYWRSSDFDKHKGFMAALQEREVGKRSLGMMNFAVEGEDRKKSVMDRIRDGKFLPADVATAKQKMKERLCGIAERAFARERLPSNVAPPTVEVLIEKIDSVSDELVSILAASEGWNNWEVGGDELHPLSWHGAGRG